MTTYEMIQKFRLIADNDPTNMHRWSDSEATYFANLAEQEACRRALIIKDNSTATYCTISLTSGTNAYVLNEKVLEVLRAKITTEDYPMEQMSRLQMDEEYPAWDSTSATNGTPTHFITTYGTEFMVYPTPDASYTLKLDVIRLPKYDMCVPYYGNGLAFDSSAKSITRSTGDWIADGYVAGNTIYISGAVNSGNNGTKTIATVSKTVLVVSETLTNENAGAIITLTTSPEIPNHYHSDLVYYMCHLAFLKNGDTAFNKDLAMLYEGKFSAVFGTRPNATVEKARRTTPLYGGMMGKKFWI